MQIKKRLKTIFSLIIILVFSFTCFKIYNQLLGKSVEKVYVPLYMEKPPSDSTILKKSSFRDAFIEEIKVKQELITLEVFLSEEIELNDTWIDWDIFKKNQKIIYKGKGIFTVDLNDINDNSILIDEERNVLQVKLKPPKINSVQINEEKTEYYSIENGIFRSQKEIEISPSEHQTLLTQIKTSMLDEMNKEEIKNQAYESAEKSISIILKNILIGITGKNYEIDIVFE